MTRSTVLTLGLVFASALTARAFEDDAKAQAQAILDKGAALFDKKDAAAMAATYSEDGQILWVAKEENSSEVKIDTKKGRAEVEAFYRDLYKNPDEKFSSKNVVEFARLVEPGLLVIQGTFQPDVAKSGKYPFTQVRVKQGDKWLIKSLQFFLFSQD